MGLLYGIVPLLVIIFTAGSSVLCNGEAVLEIHTAAAIACTSNTSSLVTVSASDVDLTDVPDAYWAFSFDQVVGGAEPPPNQQHEFNNSHPTAVGRFNWSCPKQLGVWNLTVVICNGTLSEFGCPDHAKWLVSNVTQVSVHVSLNSNVSSLLSIVGCTDDSSNTVIALTGSLFPPSPATWSSALRYTFILERPQSLPKETSQLEARAQRETLDYVTNLTVADVQMPWNCRHNEAGTWNIVLEIRDNATGALLSLSNSSVYITEYIADLKVNGSVAENFTCSSDMPLLLWHSLPHVASRLSIRSVWIVLGGFANVTIGGSRDAGVNGSTSVQWPCPAAYGSYTIVLELHDNGRTVDTLVAQSRVSVLVTALLSTQLHVSQVTHGERRSQSPLAVGNLFFDARNVTVTGTEQSLEQFFHISNTSLLTSVQYAWSFDDDATAATITTVPRTNYTYTNTGKYSPSVQIQVLHNSEVPEVLATGVAMFPDLQLLGYVSDVTVDGPHTITADNSYTNYTLECILTPADSVVVTTLCWNLSLIETNSSANPPYVADCKSFRDAASENHTLHHPFNISGIYELGCSCSNVVSRWQSTTFIDVKNPPDPPNIPVVSYTLPIVLTLTLALVGAGLLGGLVYRRRKNRHIQVADFDYISDWEHPRPRTLTDRVIEVLGRFCDCLPGPWHWNKSRRTQRYLSLTTHANDYGATHSYSMSMT